MDPQRYWLNQIRYFSIKVARCLSHIEFIESCLRVGLTPRGLTLKLPIHAAPLAMRHVVEAFSRRTSLDYARLILHEYKCLHFRYLNDHLRPLLNVVRSVSTSLANRANLILGHANYMLNLFRTNHLRKLSALYTQHLRSGFPLQLVMPPPVRGPPVHRWHRRHDQPTVDQVNRHGYEPVSLLTGQPQPDQADELAAQLADGNTVAQAQARPLLSTDDNVCNLSSRPLGEVETSLLSKGLTFTPTPRPDHIKLHEDIQEFCWRLRLKYFWHNNADSDQDGEALHSSLQKFRPPSNFDPKTLPESRLLPTHPLERYISALLQRTSSAIFLDSLTPRDNLSPEERQTLKSLKSDTSIRIMPADKGSTVVIMNTADYDREASRQLSDTRFYETVDSDPTLGLATDLRRFIKSNGRREGLSSRDIDLLVPDEPKCPDFYLLPKIHKSYSLPDRLPPGRPIVASFGCVTERVSAYVDSYLQPIVQNQPSFIKDTQHFLSVLRGTRVPEGVILVTIDVNSLYTEIPHVEGLGALTRFLQERSVPRIPSTNFLVKLAECVLTMNVFKFAGQVYLQKRGTAMGTRMAPSYANLFMADLENGFLASREKAPLLWKRFIDDIFMIWPHGEEELKLFLDDLNSRFSVTFTWSHSGSSATFLDVDITLVNGNLATSVHVKPTNKQLYLHFDSCHPPHTKRSIPRSLSIRGHRICSDRENLVGYLSGVGDKLIERGYPRRFVKDRMVPAHVNYQHRPQPTSDRVPLVTTFFFGAQKINGILRELQPILNSSPLTRDVFKELPRVAYRQGQNLGGILSHRHPRALPPEAQERGVHRCQRPRCKLCEIVVEDPFFTSPNTTHSYRCQGSADCQSHMCVYQLICKKCSEEQTRSFYIGKASQLNLRMNNHRASLNQFQQRPVKLHAREHGQSVSFNECFGVKVLKKMPQPTNDRLLQQSERAHRWVLGSNRPPGLNLND